MGQETTVTIQVVILFITTLICILTYINNRKKDIKQEEQKTNDNYLMISTDIVKVGVKIDALKDDFLEMKTELKNINNQIKEVNDRTIKQSGRIEKLEDKTAQLEKRIDALERG